MYQFLLQYSEIAKSWKLDRIEFELSIPGFNNYYKEIYGITVEESSNG